MKVSGIHSPLEFRLLHINGIALHVVLAGPPSGKPLIFLHGFPEFWFAWRRQIDHFVSSGYRVIIPDQRGYNLTDKPAGIANYSIDLLARDVVGVLDNVAGSKAFVVGHDLGGCCQLVPGCPIFGPDSPHGDVERPPSSGFHKGSHHEPRAIAKELVHVPFSAPLATRIHRA